MCTMPQHGNGLEVPEAEQRRVRKADDHNAFLNELGVLVQVLDHSSQSGDDPLEKRILKGVKVIRDQHLAMQEEREVLVNNNQELQSKLGELLAENLELNRTHQTRRRDSWRQLESLRTHLERLRETVSD